MFFNAKRKFQKKKIKSENNGKTFSGTGSKNNLANKNYAILATTNKYASEPQSECN